MQLGHHPENRRANNNRQQADHPQIQSLQLVHHLQSRGQQLGHPQIQ
jgi:hypothetical protein